MNSTKECVEIFEKYGIKASINSDGKIIISHYCQPKGSTFADLGINEDKLIENVVACSGEFNTRNSSLTTFPLEVSQEIILDENTKITEMPNLKAAGKIFVNSKLKKLPKLKAVGSISLENSIIKSLPKLKEAGILIAQNSSLKELESLENVGKLCIIDSNVENLSSLKNAQEIFICSTDENQKIDLKALKELKEVKSLFVANSTLKNLSNLKKAEKIALYNCEVKSIKSSVCKNVQIQTQITDEELSEKFDVFTDWYNSDVFDKSMDLLGNIVNKIQS